MDRDNNSLRKMIREFGFESIEEQLMMFARPSIRVHTTPVADESEIAIGRSKVGGRPDLPIAMDWLRVGQGDRQKSLHFIAQFKLQEVKPFDQEDFLPNKGLLAFFADPYAGTAVGSEGRVVYLADGTTLERKPFPEDIPEKKPDEWGDRYDPCSVTFVSEINLSNEAYDFADTLDVYPEGKTQKDLYELIHNSAYPYAVGSTWGTVNRLLGTAHNVPDDQQLYCQLIAEGFSPYYSSKDERELAARSKHLWQLLFQIDSDDKAGMMWGTREASHSISE